jgi:hypothetical protein
MESLILQGINASGLYVAGPQRALYVQNVMFNVPMSGTLTAVSVTISGAQTGAQTFYDSVAATVRFKPNEDVYFSTANFLSNYGVVINYIEVGDASSYMTTDRSRSEVQAYPTPWRFR